jgi:hypothetical protein
MCQRGFGGAQKLANNARVLTTALHLPGCVVPLLLPSVRAWFDAIYGALRRNRDAGLARLSACRPSYEDSFRHVPPS